MKARKKESPPKRAGTQADPSTVRLVMSGGVAALVAAFIVYGPALNGPFLFDDSYLPMSIPNMSPSLQVWLAGVRPVLMFTYWVNYAVSGLNTGAYHAGNILLHAANTVLMYLALRRLLVVAGRPATPAVFGAALFLLHPVQTESVAYIAGRSETLSAFFFLAALASFLWRKEPAASWSVAAVVLLLFLLALGSKEHTVVLPFVLLMTDVFFPSGPRLTQLRRNWRVYLPMGIGALAGAAFIFGRLDGSIATAGFGVESIRWYEYLFTQFRVIPVYLRLMVLPVGQCIDYALPFSRTLTDHGAVFGLLALAAITAAAVFVRKRFPLLCYGWLLFLLLLAPTSSILPIKDALAERRLYLPMLGLLVILCDAAGRLRLSRNVALPVAGLIAAAAGAATYQRSQVWSSAEALWEDTLAKAPLNPRAHFQFAFLRYSEGRCQEALEHYQRVAELEKPDTRLYIDWALTLDCLKRDDEALRMLEQATRLKKSAHAWAMIGMLHGKAGRTAQAWQALEQARAADDRFDLTYVYRGNLYASAGDWASATREYQQALALNPSNTMARDFLAQALDRRR